MLWTRCPFLCLPFFGSICNGFVSSSCFTVYVLHRAVSATSSTNYFNLWLIHIYRSRMTQWSDESWFEGHDQNHNVFKSTQVIQTWRKEKIKIRHSVSSLPFFLFSPSAIIIISLLSTASHFRSKEFMSMRACLSSFLPVHHLLLTFIFIFSLILPLSCNHSLVFQSSSFPFQISSA